MAIRKKYRVKRTIRIKPKRRNKISLLGGFSLFKKIGIGKPKRRLVRKEIASSFLGMRLRGKRKKGFLNSAVKIAGLMFIVFLIIGSFLAAGVFIYFSKDIPSADEIINRRVAESTKIYDRTGENILYEIHGEEKRTVVSLDQISDYMKWATIAIEDDRFYSHHGFDIGGIAKAVCYEIGWCKKSRGGSTITQQLIKNSILTSERTYARKIKELIIAVEMERRFSKDEILEMYFNQIPYGSNAYGIEAAAQTFFGKPARDLDLAESAMLAALPQLTTYYSPYGSHPEDLTRRSQYVLERMANLEYISGEERQAAREIDILSRVKPFQENITAPHFVMYVKQQLVDELGEDVVEKGGLKVYTTLDLEKQKIAEEAVKEGVEANMKKYSAHNAALMAINPKSGQILAMVGSKDYFGKSLPEGCVSGKNCKFDPNVNVAIRNRQPGSSFKPFVYATAFKKGYPPETILFDVDTSFGLDGSGKEFHPLNYDFKFRGPVTMRQALAQSLNIPAVKTLYLSGIPESLETAREMGFTTFREPENYGLSLVLGTGEVKLLEEVSAYGVFANEGTRYSPTAILRIEDSEGKIIKEWQDNSKQVLDAEVARQINSILSDNGARAAAFGARSKLYLGDRPVAAKTGTTQDFRDGWTIGYTPSLAVGVWAGNNDNSKMNRAGGIYAAAPIWNDFMKQALENTPVEKFTPPKPVAANKTILNGKHANEIIVKLDRACTNKLATELTPLDQIEEKTYLEIHNILYYLDKDNPLGDYPKNPSADPQFSDWETAALAWAAENVDEVNAKPPTEICNVRTGENMPEIKIISPENNIFIEKNTLFIETEAKAYFGIKQIDFFFDDLLMGSDKYSPYNVGYFIPANISKGRYTVSAKIYDGIGNVSQDEISVIVGSNSSVYLEPVSENNFPYTLNAVTDSGSVEKVVFYYQSTAVYDSEMELVEKIGPQIKIGEAPSPIPGENNWYQIIWKEDKSEFIAGKYSLWAVEIDKHGERRESERREMEIK